MKKDWEVKQMAENVMRYGETGSADNFFYLNEMNFPILADM